MSARTGALFGVSLWLGACQADGVDPPHGDDETAATSSADLDDAEDSSGDTWSEGAPNDESDESDESDDRDESDESDESDDDPTTGETDDPSTDLPDPEPECGDGVLDPEELCDDGNAIDDDACSNACVPALCGDELVQGGAGETCDFGRDNGPMAACTPECLSATCGDGYLWTEEYCDDGNLDGLDGCNAHCVAPGTQRWVHWDTNGLHLATANDGSVILGANGIDDWLARFDHDLEEPAWIVEYEGYLKDVAWHPDGMVVVQRRIGSTLELICHDGDDGDELWSIEIGTVPNVSIARSVVNGLGNIVVLRRSEHGNQVNLYDLTLTAFGPAGDEQWSVPVTDPTTVGVSQVAADELGNIFVAYTSGLGWHLLRFDALGQLIWEDFITSAEVNQIYALAAAGGRLAYAGTTTTPGADEYQPSHRDILVELRDLSGEVLWRQVHDGAEDDWLDGFEAGVDVAIDAAGNVAVLGVVQEGWPDGEAAWLGRYDGSGSLLWEHTLVDGMSRFPAALAIAPDGDVLVSMSVELEFLEHGTAVHSYAP